jgi:hypothetical protein
MNITMDDYWLEVEDALQSATRIAFDGCHKIYLAMDEEQSQWFLDNYNGKDCDDCNYVGSTQDMLQIVKRWWDSSCGLRFICAVETNHDNPSEGFTTLIPQGVEWQFENEDENEDEDY